MLLELTHQTNLRYTGLISESVMELRVTPRQDFDQHRLSFDLSIGPPTTLTSYFDWQGNAVHAFAINKFHDEIRIVATSVVETERPAVDLAGLSDRWPLEQTGGYELYDLLDFGGPVVNDPRLAELVREISPRDGEPLGQIVLRMLELFNTRFEYRRGVTTAASPITDILEHRAGVCQDFTHLMIGLARKLRVPARYVSGLIHSDASHTLRGAAETHAWVELLFPASGWIGVDATNNCVADENFVRVAIGRHFADVSPNRGVYKGAAKESIEVKVTSRVLDRVPPELAGERFGSIDLPAYPAAAVRQAERDRLRMEQQQQQQQQ